MTVGSIEISAGSDEGLAAYPAFRSRAMAAGERDFAHGFLMEDGSLVALRLDGIDPPALRPFEAVREEAAAAAAAEARRLALVTRAGEALEALRGGADPASLGEAETYTEMPRGGRVDGASPALMTEVFGLEAPGAMTTVSSGDFTAVLRLDAIRMPDHGTEESQLMTGTIARQMGQDMGQDAFALLAAALEAGADLSLDQAAINAVHAQMR